MIFTEASNILFCYRIECSYVNTVLHNILTLVYYTNFYEYSTADRIPCMQLRSRRYLNIRYIPYVADFLCANHILQASIQIMLTSYLTEFYNSLIHKFELNNESSKINNIAGATFNAE